MYKNILQFLLQLTLVLICITGKKILYWRNSHGFMAKVLDCGLDVNKFELHLYYYIHFRTNALGKGINLFILPTELNSITGVLQGWH